MSWKYFSSPVDGNDKGATDKQSNLDRCDKITDPD